MFRRSVLPSIRLNRVTHEFWGSILIGETLDPPRRVVYLRPEDFIRHTLIVGSTGSGKTTTAGIIAEKLGRENLVLVLDWYGEYSRKEWLVLTPSPQNPIPIGGSSAEEVVEVFDEVFNLTPPQSFVLLTSLEGRRFRGIWDVIQAVKDCDLEARWILETKLALLRKIRPIASRLYREMFREGSSEALLPLMNGEEAGVVAVDLSRIRNVVARRLAALFLLKHVERIKLEYGGGGNVFVFIEEAHNIIRTNSSLLGRMFAEVRKLGLSLAVITQSPTAVGASIIANSNMRVIHAIKAREDLDLILRSIGQFSQDLRMLIPRLRVGEAVIDAPGRPDPVLVRVLAGEYE